MAAFDLPASRLADAQALVARFARKATKLGMTAPVLTVTRVFPRVWTVSAAGQVLAGPFDGGLPCVFVADRLNVVTRDMVTVDIAGERPVVAGWRFAAVIEATGTEAGNILRKSPHFSGDLPERFRKCTSECDHCNTIRARNETFVVHNAEGEFKQVGRTCLRDFTGNADPAAWIAAYQFDVALDELAGWDEGEGGYASARPTVLVTGFLAMVAAQVRTVGYLSAAKARESIRPIMATGEEVFFGATHRDPAVRSAFVDAVTEEDRQLAAAAVAWVQSDDAGEVSDYVHNLRVYSAGEVVTSKGANTLASLIPAYRRFLGDTAAKTTKVNEHLPGAAIKARIRDLALTQVVEHSFDTMYGTKWILRFEDSAGRCVVWKTTSRGSGYKVGDRVLLTGTVKELGEYKGVRQTELTRCKVVLA